MTGQTGPMRLGVLDVGSNTVHLLVVDAHPGAHPTPMHDDRSVLRLAEHITADGVLSREGEKALLRAVQRACAQAAAQKCEELLPLVTSAIRDARNGLEVLDRIRSRTDVDLRVLTGEDEARLTFLAVRRWFGWSAGNLISLDIGGGSLELAAGRHEDPDLAFSLPLGAARVTRDWFHDDPPPKSEVADLEQYVAKLLHDPARRLLDIGTPDRVVATSKTFRTLARLAGAAPSSAGPRARRVLNRNGLRQVIAFISRMASKDLAELEGVSVSRAHQTLAGAVVAAGAMDALGVDELELCPWALREGVILRRLDWIES